MPDDRPNTQTHTFEERKMSQVANTEQYGKVSFCYGERTLNHFDPNFFHAKILP